MARVATIGVTLLLIKRLVFFWCHASPRILFYRDHACPTMHASRARFKNVLVERSFLYTLKPTGFSNLAAQSTTSAQCDPEPELEYG